MTRIEPEKESRGGARANPGGERARPVMTMQNDRAKTGSRYYFHLGVGNWQREAPSPEPAISEFECRIRLAGVPREHPSRQEGPGRNDQEHRRNHSGPSDAQFNGSTGPQRKQAAAKQQQADTRAKWVTNDERLSHQGVNQAFAAARALA